MDHIKSENTGVTGDRNTTPRRLTLSLSGGGYRATLFSAGAMLAIADSDMRSEVESVSSVSGGSIASAGTIGGFRDPSPEDPDPMARRVGELARLTLTNAIPTEIALRAALYALLSLGLPVFYLLVAPIGSAPLQAANDPNPPNITEDVIEFMRNSEGAIAALNFMATELPFLLLVVLPVVAIVTAGTAILLSTYAVQGVVETLAGRARNKTNMRRGTSLRDIAEDEPRTKRILCATDLGTGAHVYLTSDKVLAPGKTGKSPNVYLADAVAASACFPGFRPLVFRQKELGFAHSSSSGRPRLHSSFGRLLIGIIGVAGAVVGLAALIGRIAGVVLPAFWGFVVALVVATVGFLVALACARLLRSRSDMILVDGGVCDNLGAAFALLSRDDRYRTLPRVAGTNKPGLMLVIDASKPFVPSTGGGGLDELIPLRLRGAQRSILKLLGSANSAARKHVIQLSLAAQGDVTGAIVSIEEAPLPVDGSGPEWNLDRKLDYESIMAATSSESTTLSALTPTMVVYLILHGYRLTQAKLTQHGVRIDRTRSAQEIVDEIILGPEASPKAKAFWSGWPESAYKVPLRAPRISSFDGLGPYSRLSRRLRLLSFGVLILVWGAAGALFLFGPELPPWQ